MTCAIPSNASLLDNGIARTVHPGKRTRLPKPRPSSANVAGCSRSDDKLWLLLAFDGRDEPMAGTREP